MENKSPDAILDQFECVVCTDYMHPPIMLCNTGHSLCNFCAKQLKNCPQCEDQITTKRNYVLEKLHDQVLFQCSNKGCLDVLKGSKIIAHITEECVYAIRSCPVLFDKCPWKGNKLNLKDHCLIDHANQCATKSILRNIKLRLQINKLCISAFNQLFIFDSHYEHIANARRTIAHCTIFIVAQKKIVHNYIYEICLKNSETGHMQSIKGPCVQTDWIDGDTYTKFREKYQTISLGHFFEYHFIKVYRKELELIQFLL